MIDRITNYLPEEYDDDEEENEEQRPQSQSLVIEAVSSCNSSVPHISPVGRDVFLNNKIEEETTRAKAKEDELEAEIRQAGKVDDVKVDGTSVVTNKVANINLQPTRDLITQEKNRAEAAESTLQTNITNEANLRTSADATLQANINSEAALRTAADTNLSSAISTESSSRISADNALQTNITSEESARSAADTTLQTNINNEAASRTSADTNLQEQIDNLKARGRYLSLWNAVTGLPADNPGTLPYLYKSGDYYIIGTVKTSPSETNKQPHGSSYDGTASTTLETREIAPDDVYYYDGTNWALQINTRKTTRFESILGNPYDNTNLAAALNSKADVSIVPTVYLKNASVSGITLTLVKHDDTTIQFVGSDITVAEEREIEDE